MTISYPLAFPTHTRRRSVEMRATNAVAYASSPFTFAGQAFAYPGQMWQADVTLPPMKRTDAEQWVAWLMSLRGQLGTFLMGDMLGCTPRGTALGSKKNLMFYTEQFDNAVWIKARTTITANSGVAPDGFTTADAMVEATVTGSHSVADTVNCSPSTTYVWSVYVKQVPGGTQRIRLRADDNLTFLNDVVFNFNTGQLVTPSAGRGFEDIGNGWYRIWCSGTTGATATSLTHGLTMYQGDTTVLSYTGDGVSSVLIWGAQVEAGSVMTAYQPIAASYGPFVNGAGQTGDTLVVDGCSPNETGFLLPGDYIQLGSGSTATLHKVLTQVDTDSSGNATLDIWPHIRTAPADNAAVTVSNTVGRWRLASNETSWSVNEAAIYGIRFSAMEAV